MKNTNSKYHVSQLTHFEMLSSLIASVSPDFFDLDIDDVDFGGVYARLSMEHNTSASGTMRAGEFTIRRDICTFWERVHKAKLSVIRNAINTIEGTRNSAKVQYDAKYMLASSDSDADTVKALMSIVHDFDACGRKMFRVEEQLQNELFLTDVLKVDDGFVHLPFPTICLYLPFNEALRVYGQLVRHVYVSELDGDDGERLLEVFAVTDDELHHRHLYTLNGGDIESQLKAQIGELYKNSPMARAENMKLVSFIVATLLYVNTVDSDQTSVAPKVLVPGKNSRLPMCSLGRHITVQQGMSGMAASANGTQSERMVHVLKWTVRGHFRRYRVGKDRNDSKTIWIRPFLKGRERDLDIAAKPAEYVLK